MSFRGKSNWPPHWTAIAGATLGEKVKGEIGVLREAQVSGVDDSRCFLTAEYKGDIYLACLWFDDRKSCQRIYNLLQRHIGESVAKIAELHISV